MFVVAAACAGVAGADPPPLFDTRASRTADALAPVRIASDVDVKSLMAVSYSGPCGL